MTNSESEQTYYERQTQAVEKGEPVLGVLTGQVPIQIVSEPRRAGKATRRGLDHDHENVCCVHHGTHADPHKGCPFNDR